MKKRELINELEKVEKTIKHLSTINETLSFADDEEAMDYIDEPQDTDSIDNCSQTIDNNEGKDTISQIKSIALSTMAELSKNGHENNNYQTLKKIWQLCEKKIETDSKEQIAKSDDIIQ